MQEVAFSSKIQPKHQAPKYGWRDLKDLLLFTLTNQTSIKNNKIYDEYLYYLIDTYVKHNKYKDIIINYEKSILKYHIEMYENINNIKVLFQ